VAWDVKYKHIYWLIFHPIFIPNHTQAVGEIWVYIEFIVDSLPTLRILGEKKVAKIPQI